MRKLALLLALAAFPAQAWALNTSELLSTIAMPLAVAAVSNVSGVSNSQLANLVVTLNQANVPSARFVEVIRYVPVALVDQNGQPFVAYVQEQTTQGVTGDALVNAIVDRLRTNYNVAPALRLNGEPIEVVVREDYIPSMVTTTRFESDPLSVIALPLAVAAVADVNGVSRDDLANLIATLNNANVPPVQEIEIIRYAPVALVADNGQAFVQFVQQQTTQGVTGLALVPVVVQQLQTYYPPQTQIALNTTPRQVVVERDFFPPVVVNRVEEVRLHPHGGPPGQIKKQLGLQTGAEVVHGVKPGRQFTPAPVAVVPRKEHGHGHGKHAQAAPPPAPMISSAPPAAAPPVMPPGLAKGHHEGGPPAGPPGQAKPKGGKGHGKD